MTETAPDVLCKSLSYVTSDKIKYYGIGGTHSTQVTDKFTQTVCQETRRVYATVIHVADVTIILKLDFKKLNVKVWTQYSTVLILKFPCVCLLLNRILK
jgi:hypothetical protein